MNNDIYVIYILKKIINNDDIIDNIFNMYIIDKYFNKKLTNKSIKLFKNKYSKDNYYTDMIINMIKPNYFNIYYIKQLLITNDITLKIIEKTPIIIKSLSYEYKNNKQILLSICKKDYSLIKYASHELKANYNFINEMINIYPASIYYASNELKDNYTLALKAVSMDGDTIEYISDRLRNNNYIYNIALKNKFNYF